MFELISLVENLEHLTPYNHSVSLKISPVHTNSNLSYFNFFVVIEDEYRGKSFTAIEARLDLDGYEDLENYNLFLKGIAKLLEKFINDLMEKYIQDGYEGEKLYNFLRDNHLNFRYYKAIQSELEESIKSISDRAD